MRRQYFSNILFLNAFNVWKKFVPGLNKKMDLWSTLSLSCPVSLISRQVPTVDICQEVTSY